MYYNKGKTGPETSNYRHGMSRSSEYMIWIDMKRRCYDVKNNAFSLYGGRGITVCPTWVDSFQAFYADMGPRPSARHTIDRVDNNGPYAPGNCRWATMTEQNSNKRTNIYLTVGGETHTLAEWTRQLGMRRGTVGRRLRHGWSPEDAVRPIDSRFSHIR